MWTVFECSSYSPNAQISSTMAARATWIFQNRHDETAVVSSTSQKPLCANTRCRLSSLPCVIPRDGLIPHSALRSPIPYTGHPSTAAQA
jgi:hypothetical protein